MKDRGEDRKKGVDKEETDNGEMEDN